MKQTQIWLNEKIAFCLFLLPSSAESSGCNKRTKGKKLLKTIESNYDPNAQRIPKNIDNSLSYTVMETFILINFVNVTLALFLNFLSSPRKCHRTFLAHTPHQHIVGWLAEELSALRKFWKVSFFCGRREKSKNSCDSQSRKKGMRNMHATAPKREWNLLRSGIKVCRMSCIYQ